MSHVFMLPGVVHFIVFPLARGGLVTIYYDTEIGAATPCIVRRAQSFVLRTYTVVL